MKLATLVDTSERVRMASGRREKVHHLAQALRDAGPGRFGLAVSFLSGRVRQGRIGVGTAVLRDALPVEPAATPAMTLHDLDRIFSDVQSTTGSGSVEARKRLLSHLLGRCTEREQGFVIALLFGELRQGANEGVIAEAIAEAAGVPSAAVRRSAMLSGDLSEVAEAAFSGGEAALATFGLRLFRPVQPMLASSADSPDAAMARLDEAAVEFKLDGARIQVHKAGGDVRVFSRRLRDVTPSVPELVEAVAALPMEELVLDGETLALRADGRPHPFQVSMRRFGRKLDVSALRTELPLSSFFFDCLYADGDTLIDQPGAYRMEVLEGVLPPGLLVRRELARGPGDVEALLAIARGSGHEGVMVKDLTASYAAGRRGKSWIKLKPAHTLDLVVLAAEWGHGRRKGWLSNLHLGARDPVTGGFVMLGKTFKGLTDELLTWQTEALQRIEVARDRHTVYVEPRLVVEIAFNEIQESPRYPGGLALRFARVKAYRPERSPEDSDTIDTVRAIHAAGP
jgi:DNA ligase-1